MKNRPGVNSWSCQMPRRRALAGQEKDDLGLDRIGVLKFIYQHARKPLSGCIAYAGVPAQYMAS